MSSTATKQPWEILGENFVSQYYDIFDSNRENILALFHGDSSRRHFHCKQNVITDSILGNATIFDILKPSAMFTFEENKAQGVDQIKEILTVKLRFNAIKHIVTKIDCQPTSENGVIVLVTGRLKTDEDPPHAYSQCFIIKPENDSYYLYHDIFRLSIHDSM